MRGTHVILTSLKEPIPFGEASLRFALGRRRILTNDWIRFFAEFTLSEANVLRMTVALHRNGSG